MESKDSNKNVNLAYEQIDRLYQARLARLTLGVSPATVAQALFSWITQLALCPGRLMELRDFPFHQSTEILKQLAKIEGHSCSHDRRFRSESWNRWPWRSYAEWFCYHQRFWKVATDDIPGLAPPHQRIVSFMTRQRLDAMSPTNFIWTNPDLMTKSLETLGVNLANGAFNALEDLRRRIAGEPPSDMENFKVGENVAVSEGKVVFRNDLIELIQYNPKTEEVYKEPILIIPAWIMKYYILDLSPQNSMVKWLVSQGHTVFVISWKNPGSEDRDKGIDNYISEGSLTAINVVSDIIPNEKIHITGYCLGGTLSIITAAYLAASKDNRLKSLTLFAAQGDFTEPGEISLFINHSEVSYLKNMMWTQGFLDTKQMSGAFQMIKSTEMIWSRMVNEYLMGERDPLFDLMAWNADTTRMPYKMQSEYLERLVLNNELASGHYSVLGKTIAPENITIPVFVVGTEKDHVAPWVSVYKINFMTTSDVTFVLTSGGHNAGIVSEPGHPRRYYYIDTKLIGESYKSPSEWLKGADKYDGSWWIAWNDWLKKQSGSEMQKAPKKLGSATYKPLGDAPGLYVHQQ
jgi:polyhydroxyalkanoate synthase